ncbi:NAD+ synthase [Marinagarivorans algicola]|uniref:NAD+ synthase n=1 Tax=Marinagarivorans algicola TaxID=1513270 RepID=UPI0006B684E7|nr:NAD+ synthase [Marinagarivorans algicola]
MSMFVTALAQINPLVGDIPGNTQLVVQAAERSKNELGAQVVVFPELTLTGYPPEDLLLRPSLEARIKAAIEVLKAHSQGIALVVGYPKQTAAGLMNMAAIIYNGRLLIEYAKQHLPNYQVFDEKRYFIEGQNIACAEIEGIKVALTVCEDIWHDGPAQQAKQAGADVMFNLNASPFHINKQSEREQLLAKRAVQAGMPIVYVNQVGGQDELVFDGGSMVVNSCGTLVHRAPLFATSLTAVSAQLGSRGLWFNAAELADNAGHLPSVYQALVTGVRDYVNKNRFKGVVLGLSGGIDSALTLAIAVDALGAECVEAVMMPFKYTSMLSQNDAAEQASRMGVKYRSISIEPIFHAFSAALAEEFEGLAADTTEENLQARSRGVVLMAISNKKGALVLTTGNKSELAVGYCTLYGDMAGGFDVLKDVPKMLVFELSKYRNTVSPVIPESVISRPPSAELAPDQVDEDSLPPYEELDEILRLYIEEDSSAEAVIAAGFDSEAVHRILRLVDINEYKRRQAAIGPRITQRGFGRDRRYPMTNGWQLGN